ncbi:RNA polymerase sigma factor [Curvibacter sp. APW13]|uniref:RNA polymerase sigma factor n=1 Tax=Curvibacter sp. APW13 TaxID=3077236 RepID=UPI0028DFD3D4|nr:RNA polymerase sigma factor [Curvibacter sp. APW13]MDT8990639.1 RNA polymerase sigma factor [Curvibacter sp. APW13]
MQPQAIVEYIPALRRYARALTGDAWAADDLVQDTLERACSRWRLWLAGSDLRAWLFTVMHNLFVSAYRRRQAAPATVALDDLADELPGPHGAPDNALDLQRCLMRLPDEQREVLLLVTLEDLSYAEVARITGTPIGTVMSRLSRARERLRTLMEAPAQTSLAAIPLAEPASVPPLRRLK